jgi:hypothetical protein
MVIVRVLHCIALHCIAVDCLQLLEWISYLQRCELTLGIRVLSAYIPLCAYSPPFGDGLMILLRKFLATRDPFSVGRRLALHGLVLMLFVMPDTRFQLDILAALRPALAFPLALRREFYELLEEALRSGRLKLGPEPAAFLRDALMTRLQKCFSNGTLHMAGLFEPPAGPTQPGPSVLESPGELLRCLILLPPAESFAPLLATLIRDLSTEKSASRLLSDQSPSSFMEEATEIPEKARLELLAPVYGALMELLNSPPSLLSRDVLKCLPSSAPPAEQLLFNLFTCFAQHLPPTADEDAPERVKLPIGPLLVVLQRFAAGGQLRCSETLAAVGLLPAQLRLKPDPSGSLRLLDFLFYLYSSLSYRSPDLFSNYSVTSPSSNQLHSPRPRLFFFFFLFITALQA